MQITILTIIEIRPNGAYVEFASPHGKGSSYFCGAIPEEHQVYDVEVDINDEFYWNINLKPSLENEPSIRADSGNFHVTAELIVSEDGCSTLKLGSSVVLISSEKTPVDLPIFVDLIAKETSLHPTNI